MKKLNYDWITAPILAKDPVFFLGLSREQQDRAETTRSLNLDRTTRQLTIKVHG